mgnify:CR=1 FL=1
MWFTETPWPPILILAVIGIGFLAAAVQTQRANWLIAVMLTVLLAGGVWWVERIIVTPAEQVEVALLSMINAFQKNNDADTVKYISPGNPSLIALAKTGIALVDIDPDYRVTDIQINMSNQNTTASSHFRLNATIRMTTQGNLGHMPLRFQGKWKREGEQWKLTVLEELDPIRGDVLNRFHVLK